MASTVALPAAVLVKMDGQVIWFGGQGRRPQVCNLALRPVPVSLGKTSTGGWDTDGVCEVQGSDNSLVACVHGCQNPGAMMGVHAGPARHVPRQSVQLQQSGLGHADPS